MVAPEIPEKMQAVQVIEYNKPYHITHIPVPTPGATELLVRVGCASLCHTDSMVVAGAFASNPTSKLPLVASHEGAGTVVALGAEVSGWSVGDRVMCPIVTGRCLACANCKGPESFWHYCPNEGHRGVTRDGAFAEYMTIDARETSKLPDEVSFEVAAPLACAGRTVYRALKIAGLAPGETIALIGSGGGLGHIGIQFARALKLRVIGLDARDGALDLSRSLGAELVLDARQPQFDVVQAVQDFTNGLGADAAINLSDAPAAAGLACAVTKMHGTMVQVAQPESVSVPFPELVFRDVRVRGSLLCSKGEADEMLGLVARRGLDVRMEKVGGLEKVPELVDMAREGRIRGKGVVLVEKGAA